MLSTLFITGLLGSALAWGDGGDSSSEVSRSCRCKSDTVFEIEQVLLELRYALDDRVLGLITASEYSAIVDPLFTDDFSFTFDFGSGGTLTGGRDEFIAVLESAPDGIRDYRFSFYGGFYYEDLKSNRATVRENILNISPQLNDGDGDDTTCRQDNTAQRVVYDLRRESGNVWKLTSLLLANIHNLPPPESSVDC